MNINEILEAVAEQNGTTVKEVRHEMELAIYSAKDKITGTAIMARAAAQRWANAQGWKPA